MTNSENKAAENKAVENTAVENKAAENTAAENKAAENKAAENTAVENTAVENKAAENTASENKAAENKAVENKAAENKAVENKAVENKAVCLFIGVPLSMRSLRAVSQAASEFKQKSASESWDLRWVAPARYHVTLKYLGWTKPEAITAIQDVVEAAIAGHKAFDMRCRGIGAFPSLDKAKVLWAGLDDRLGDLSKLAEKLDQALVGLGFEGESQSFTPHVTMARLKEASNLTSLVQDETAHMFSKSLVDSLTLYKSSVESGPSDYETLATWCLD